VLNALFLFLFRQSARLSLPVLHRIGTALGWAAYLLSGKYAERLRDNLLHALPQLSDHEFRRILRSNVAEMGKSLAELPWIWLRPLDQVLAGVQSCHGWDDLTAALARGKGVLIVTPHLGSFEMVGQYVTASLPMTTLYRPPRLTWLEPIMRQGRQRGLLQLARTDVSGVRAMLKALKRGEAVGLLPDQAPSNGEGIWVNFFGRPAYTMTLAERLAQATGATIIMAYAERLPDGAGYILRFFPLTTHESTSVTEQMSAAVEQLVRACPAQYLWSYNRYKTPAGVQPPVPPTC